LRSRGRAWFGEGLVAVAGLQSQGRYCREGKFVVEAVRGTAVEVRKKDPS
jgi:hypothetical protein